MNSPKMIQMHEEGKISDEHLLIYGMQGDLPDPEWLRSLEANEQEKYWNKKLTQKLGENWRERFRSLPAFLKRVVVSSRLIPKWSKDGF